MLFKNPLSNTPKKILTFSMNPSCFYILLLNLLFINVSAQTAAFPNHFSPQDSTSNFQPSLAVVIGILAVMFSLTFFLLLYAKFCHRPPTPSFINRRQIQDGLLRSRSRSRFSGIDKSVIESLPFFKFSSLKGSKEGLECAICLSKFEDVEILRLLPKCKHAFHTNCLDQWLEKHSSCPLCRHKIKAEDLSTWNYSNSLRFLWSNNQSNLREDSNIELFVQREESRRGSSRFSIPNISFRKGRLEDEEELPIQQGSDEYFHKFNHKIMVSDVVLKHRWSNLSSLDLVFLKSEMLLDMSSARFEALESSNSVQSRGNFDEGIMDIKEEMGRKREFETKFGKIKQNDTILPIENPPKAEDSSGVFGNASKKLSPNERRSMSEIVVHSRYQEFFRGNVDQRGHSSNQENNNLEEERVRRIWLPIARRTVKWFANRERRSTQGPTQEFRQGV